MLEQCLSLLVPVKRAHKSTAHKVILYNCVLRTFWHQFEEEAHMGFDGQVSI